MVTLKGTIKSWFQNGLKPTQEQFWAWLDSFWHKDEKIPITAIEDIEGILDAKADAQALTSHLTDENAHAALFEQLTELINNFEPTPQGLQSVLNTGTYAQFDNGNSYVDILGGVFGSLYIELFLSNGLANQDNLQSKFGINKNLIALTNVNGNDIGQVLIDKGIVELYRWANEIGKKTNVLIERPIADTTLKFPAKAEGTYTIAMLEDIAPPRLGTFKWISRGSDHTNGFPIAGDVFEGMISATEFSNTLVWNGIGALDNTNLENFEMLNSWILPQITIDEFITEVSSSSIEWFDFISNYAGAAKYRSSDDGLVFGNWEDITIDNVGPNSVSTSVYFFKQYVQFKRVDTNDLTNIIEVIYSR